MDSANETVNLEDGMAHVEMGDLIEEMMKCFHCNGRFGSMMEMEDHLSEEHRIDREAYRAIMIKWSSYKTATKEGKNEVR